MNGWDFAILWKAGLAVLMGRDPYSVEYFYYPLPFAYLLSVFALFPERAAFWLWILFNLGLLIACFRKDFWQWVLYVPVIHLFSSGQVELLFWALARGLQSGWRSALFGAFITLKPQAAFVYLPWHLLRWLREDRRTLVLWGVFTTFLWGFPLLWQPDWISEWLRVVSPFDVLSAKNTPSVFSLLQVFPGWLPVLVVVAGFVFFWGQNHSLEIARATALLANPWGLFYSAMTVMDCAPAKLLVPISWLATALAVLTGTFVPFIMLPLVVLLWHRGRKRSQI